MFSPFLFVMPLVKAVQELSKTIDSLKAAKPQTAIQNDKVKNNTDTLHITLTLPSAATLGDAQPNPNDGKAVIPYYIPDGISNAEVVFTDMLGRVMQQKKLNTGYGIIDINAQDLPSGIYYYTLSINGKVFETKKMIRSK